MARGRKKTHADGAAGAEQQKKRMLHRYAVLRGWADSVFSWNLGGVLTVALHGGTVWNPRGTKVQRNSSKRRAISSYRKNACCGRLSRRYPIFSALGKFFFAVFRSSVPPLFANNVSWQFGVTQPILSNGTLLSRVLRFWLLIHFCIRRQSHISWCARDGSRWTIPGGFRFSGSHVRSLCSGHGQGSSPNS